MTERRDLDFLRDIQESISLIKRYMDNMNKEQFLMNQEKQDATINRLMIIGEATKLISSDIRNKYTSVSWKKMAGMRDIMIHRYHGIDLEIVWETINDDLDDVAVKVKNIIKDLNQKNKRNEENI
jgi:uncharacterized protein with HEPN domain